MYKRDVAILLLSAFAVYFSVQHEGPVAFRKAWFHHIDEALDDFDLAPPIVTDLNGDGTPEVVVTTQDCRLQLLRTQPPGRKGDGFAAAVVLSEVTLVPPGWPQQLTGAKRAIAVKSGYIDPKPLELVRAPRKQVLVVVLADWTVLCFDHALRTLWTSRAREEVGGPYGWAGVHARVREVAVHVSNHSMRVGDRGMVVVGGSLELGDLAHNDVLEAELKAEADSAAAQAQHTRKAAQADAWKVGDVDISRHFSYQAMDGGTGEMRWKHEGRDFHRHADAAADATVPQHNFRLDAAALEGRHAGEADCREFRESVLAALPHRWVRREDTQLRLAHFAHHRSAPGARKADLAARGAGGPPKAHHRPNRPPPSPERHGLDASNPIARLIGQVAERAGRGKTAAHHPGSHAPAPPNVLLAQLAEGLEAVHLYSGRTVCKLHLPPGGLHTDLNADGVPDHLQVVAEAHLGSAHSDLSHARGRSCWAFVRSGVPPRQHLFNASVCHHSEFAEWLRGAGSERADAPLEIAPPAVLPMPIAHGHYRRGAGMAAFLTSRGELTALDWHGHLMWQHNIGVEWANWEGAAASHAVAPTLEAVPLRWGGIPTALLAAGATQAALVSEHGHVLDAFPLPAPPQLPLLAADWNGDGLTDAILVARDGVFGFAQVRRPGAMPFSALLALLIAAMAFVYATHQSGPGPARKGRSTDRVD